MQALFYHYDWSIWSVLTTLHCRAKPVNDMLAHHVAISFPWFMRIVNNDGPVKTSCHTTSATPRNRAFRSSSINHAPLFRAKFVFCGAVISNLNPRENLLINLMAHYFTHAVSVIRGQPLRVAGVNPFAVRVYACRPSDKAHHCQLCFAGPWGNVNDKPGGVTQHNTFQRITDCFLMPIRLHVCALSSAEHGSGERQ